tara:strand:- start:4925 stop:6094 length:1170 start_codon:yes stop_codon:yes gene_type:complete
MNAVNVLVLSLIICSQCLAESQKLYIGLDADMSAVAKTGGIAISRGAQIAIDEINQQGGLLGKELALIVKDHRGNPARGMDNLLTLAKQPNLLAVLGGVHTPVALRELPIIHQHNLIYLGPWAAGTPIVDNNYEPNFVFRISVRDTEAGKVFINYAKSLGISKIGLLLERTAWGRSNERSITASAAESAIEVSNTAWFNWGQKDFSESLRVLKKQEVEAIVLVANTDSGVEIARNILADSSISKLPIISHWGITGGDFVSSLGLDNLNALNLSILQTYSFESPYYPEKNNYLIARYQDLFNPSVTHKTIPGASGLAHAYDLVHLLAIAVKKAGSTKRKEIRNALETIGSYRGLVKHYQPAFSINQHDALMAEDYMMSRFDEAGWLRPIK